MFGRGSEIPVTLLGWIFTGLLLVLLAASIAAGRGKIPINHLFGIRLPALKQSDAAWRAGHAAAVLPAACSFVVALVSVAIGLKIPAADWVAIATFVGGVVWALVRATRAATAVSVTSEPPQRRD